jgi:hypothetical protein
MLFPPAQKVTKEQILAFLTMEAAKCESEGMIAMRDAFVKAATIVRIYHDHCESNRTSFGTLPGVVVGRVSVYRDALAGDRKDRMAASEST